jgi:hypothetical protein
MSKKLYYVTMLKTAWQNGFFPIPPKNKMTKKK